MLVDDPALAPAARALARHQHGLLTTRQCREHGVTATVAERRVRTGRWRRPTRGVYDVAGLRPVQLPPAVRHRRAAILALLAYGADAVAVGPSALALLEVWGLPTTVTPQCALPGADRRQSRDGLRCRRFEVGTATVLVDGFVVDPALALAQSIVEVTPRTALGLIDSALHRGVISTEQLPVVRDLTRGRRGSAALAQLWELVDGRRESPLESWAYVDLHEAGLTPTDVQVEVRNAAEVLVARGDIGFELDDGEWLLVELKGREFHLEAAADDRRRNRLVVAGGTRSLEYWSRDLGPRGPLVSDLGDLLTGRAWAAPRRPADSPS